MIPFIDDLYWLQKINGIIGSNADYFYWILFSSDRLPWVLFSLALCGMWYFGTPGLLANKPGGLLRIHARLTTILTLGAMPVLFVAAKIIQLNYDIQRPLSQVDILSIPIPPQIWSEVVDGLKFQNSFPSDHAAVFFLLATVAFGLNRWFGLTTLVLATFFSLGRVALGFHWPSDIIFGASIGILAGLSVLLLSFFLRNHYVSIQLPYRLSGLPSVFFYLFLFDCSYKFNHIIFSLEWLTGAL